MNKAWMGIISGCVLIIGIMVFLTIKGVTKRAHTYIKWSQVNSFEKVGGAVFKRLYPQWEKIDSVYIQDSGHDILKGELVTSLQKEMENSPWKTKVLGDDKKEESLVIEMVPLDTRVSPEGCGNKPRLVCLKLKALRKFHKKERDHSKRWFYMQWVKPNLFYLYFNAPLAQG